MCCVPLTAGAPFAELRQNTHFTATLSHPRRKPFTFCWPSNQIMSLTEKPGLVERGRRERTRLLYAGPSLRDLFTAPKLNLDMLLPTKEKVDICFSLWNYYMFQKFNLTRSEDCATNAALSLTRLVWRRGQNVRMPHALTGITVKSRTYLFTSNLK